MFGAGDRGEVAMNHENSERIEIHPTIKEGWFFPENSRKAHYIVEGRSLCGKWGCLSEHNNQMTKKQLVTIRNQTYRAPSERRCETCKHYWPYGSHCQAVLVRDRSEKFEVHPAGVCDLWKKGTPEQ